MKPSSCATSVGGTRPPAPTVVASTAGSTASRTVTSGLPPICVVVRFTALLPGRNSLTSPLTSTLCPAATVGREEVKTSTASEVATSPSPESWR